MLEIIAVIGICRYVSRILKEVNATAWPFVVLVVAMWFGFEFMGALVAAIVTYDRHNPNGGLSLSVYLAAIVCAGVGGGLSVLIAKLRVASLRRRQEAEDLMRPTPLR